MKGAVYRAAAARVGNRPYRKALISVHGLMSTAMWQSEINTALTDNDIRHNQTRYGVKIVPGFGGNAVREIVRAYEDHQAYNPDLRISLIAHSFGTLAAGRLLQRYPEARLERIIFYGSVLPRSFNWSHVAEREQVQKVLNEICPRDYIVRLACCLPHGGVSGCTGFVDTAHGVVEQRSYPATGHTALGTRMHCEEVWVPFILLGILPRKTATDRG